MATVRQGVMRFNDGSLLRSGRIIDEQVTFNDFNRVVCLIDRHCQQRRVNLKATPNIVAGGAGVGSKADFQLI